MDLEIRYVPLKDDLNCEPDLKVLKKLINGNTVMVVASAPQYPQGMKIIRGYFICIRGSGFICVAVF